MTSNVKGPNSLSLTWLKVIISWSHINFVWIVSKLYMYPSIIMRSCLSFMGKHNIWTKVLESVFFSANPLLNIFTQTLSLKSHKKSICEVFTCAPFQMLQLHGKTNRKYMYRNLQFMFSDFSFKCYSSKRPMQNRKFKFVSNWRPSEPAMLVYLIFGKYLVEVRKRPEDLTFLSTT